MCQVGAYDAADVLMARLTALGMQPAAWAPLSAVLSEAVTEELAPILDRLAPKGVLTPGLLETAEVSVVRHGCMLCTQTCSAARTRASFSSHCTHAA